ncbi:MAG: hypothetical protein HON90_10770 [Halobacteriovoraceae bacterium]|jgi:U32 family peptidase|nr:hypothetical protein [Halobacteriovoraceae bacterium]
MNYLTYAQSIHDLSIIRASGIKEVIISNKYLSRFSKLECCRELMLAARKLNLTVILEWDILIVESDFAGISERFNAISSELYDVIRVQDVGVLEYILETTSKPIQFVAQTGNHNLIGLQKWVSYIGTRLERIILSLELNKDAIKNYCQQLSCPVEVLVVGPILLFYSPRKLLSAPLLESINQEVIEAMGESEESPHKGFPILENRHGTFMFHIKDLFLLDKLDELMQTGAQYYRLDLRHQEDLNLITDIVNPRAKENHFAQVKQAYKRDVIRGYFHINKSDVLFKKLKNSRVQRKDEHYIGEVIETKKSDYMAIWIRTNQTIKLDDELKFINPEGKQFICKVYMLKNSSYESVESCGRGQLALINYMGGVWPKSQVYINSESLEE